LLADNNPEANKKTDNKIDITYKKEITNECLKNAYRVENSLDFRVEGGGRPVIPSFYHPITSRIMQKVQQNQYI